MYWNIILIIIAGALFIGLMTYRIFRRDMGRISPEEWQRLGKNKSNLIRILLLIIAIVVIAIPRKALGWWPAIIVIVLLILVENIIQRSKH